MNKRWIVLAFLLGQSVFYAQEADKDMVNKVLDDWHLAAAHADFAGYFGLMADDAVFIGTDATENWKVPAFREFSKPYFDKGRAWSFTSIERNVYLSPDGTVAWFDELLDTWMKLCRGSGVLKKVDGQWKIAHYVLSVTVPNENVGELIDIKKQKDSLLLLELREQ